MVERSKLNNYSRIRKVFGKKAIQVLTTLVFVLR